MMSLFSLSKNDIKKLKKEFYSSGYGNYLLKDIIAGYISIIVLLTISFFLTEIDSNISIVFLIFSCIISFFVILEYFRVEYILFEKFLIENKKE